MTSIGQSSIIKLTKVAFSTQTRNKSSFRKLVSNELSISQVISCNTTNARLPHYLFDNLFIARHLSQGRERDEYGNKSTDDANQTQNDSDKTHQSSSSSTYQKYHRSRYQQKREYYEGGQNNGQSGTQPRTNSNFTISHYQRLNISPESDAEAIKSAYYSLSKEYHPDIVGTEDAQSTENFRKITEAYDVLSDPQRRSAYDRELGLDLRAFSSFDGLGQSTNPNKEHRPLYRARDTDMIFRSRLETAMELEKRRNPRKFQAGKFDDDVTEGRSDIYEYHNLSKRLRSLDMKGYSTRDDTSFYRRHLAETIRRRRDSVNPTLSSESYSGEGYGGRGGATTGEVVPLLLALGTVVVLVAYAIINVLYDIDLAADLDTWFDVKMKSMETSKNSPKRSN